MRSDQVDRSLINLLDWPLLVPKRHQRLHCHVPSTLKEMTNTTINTHSPLIKQMCPTHFFIHSNPKQLTGWTLAISVSKAQGEHSSRLFKCYLSGLDLVDFLCCTAEQFHPRWPLPKHSVDLWLYKVNRHIRGTQRYKSTQDTNHNKYV